MWFFAGEGCSLESLDWYISTITRPPNKNSWFHHNSMWFSLYQYFSLFHTFFSYWFACLIYFILCLIRKTPMNCRALISLVLLYMSFTFRFLYKSIWSSRSWLRTIEFRGLSVWSCFFNCIIWSACVHFVLPKCVLASFKDN